MIWKNKYAQFGVVDENTNEQEISQNHQRPSSFSLLTAFFKNALIGNSAPSQDKLLKGFILFRNYILSV